MLETVDRIKSVIAPDQFARRSVHVIDLSALRAQTGPLWNKIHDGVHAKLENILRTRLGPADSFERIADGRYLVFTPQAGGEEAAIVCLRIAHELIVTLNERCELDQLRIETASMGAESSVVSCPLSQSVTARLVEKSQITDVILPNHLQRKPSPKGDSDAPKKTFASGTLRVEHAFEPVWNAHRQVVSTYLCTPYPIALDQDGAPKVGLAELSIRDRCEVELSSIAEGIGHLSRQIEAGGRFLLGLPISFESLCSPFGRMEFAGTCRGLPAIYRQYLIFVLTDVPLGVAQSRLTDLTMILRPFGRIIASVASGSRNFSAYDGHRFAAMALDASVSEGDPERQRADIVNVAAAARYAHCATMIMNVGNARTLSTANAADFQMLHGPAVASPVASPQSMVRLSTESVMADAGEGGSEEWF